MRSGFNRVVFALAGIGLLAALSSAFLYALPQKPPPPAFPPPQDPYPAGLYANGIVESAQSHGENVNVYPEVTGVVRAIYVAEGQTVGAGTPLLALDDSVQRATVEQERAQAEAARALLAELRAEPRREILAVSRAQVTAARANLRTSRDSWHKQRASWRIDHRSVSRDALDSARNAVRAARANLLVARRQLQLTRAGAWVYDIRNQERQAEALEKAWASGEALLAKYVLRAPADSVVRSIGAAVGSYLSPQGVYDGYTGGFDPPVVLSHEDHGDLQLRCFVDEVLIPRLPPLGQLTGTMFVRGRAAGIPLSFVRVQPYVSPKIELANERLERVDLRVLPLIFRFQPPGDASVYPGQLVDVYLGRKAEEQSLLDPPDGGR